MGFLQPASAVKGRTVTQRRAPSAGLSAQITPKKRGQALFLQAGARLHETRYIVPILVRIARREHHGKTRRTIAVLAAWGDLAGITGWNEEMIDIVAEALR